MWIGDKVREMKLLLVLEFHKGIHIDEAVSVLITASRILTFLKVRDVLW